MADLISADSHLCPVDQTARIIASKWTPLIIRDLVDGCKRFVQLQKSLEGISPKTLSERLRQLESQGIITRRCFAEVPPRVEYSLTPKGAALLPVIDSMRHYGLTWLCIDEPRQEATGSVSDATRVDPASGVASLRPTELVGL